MNTFLLCSVCNEYVHINCLKKPGTPGDLLGDVFFEFTCIKCSRCGKEVFIRQKLPWLIVIILAIYNLSIQSQGLSNQGFFHWRSHIAYFIEKNWKYIFNISIKRKKRWIGTISGILSHHSPEFFSSGQNILKEQGWWKLTHNNTPKFYWKLYEESLLKKQQFRNINKCKFPHNPKYEMGVNNYKTKLPEMELENSCSRLLPYMGHGLKETQPDKLMENTDEINNVQLNLKEFLEENLSSGDSFFDECIKTKGFFGSKITDDSFLDHENIDNSILSECNFEDNVVESTFVEFDGEIAPRIIQVSNYQENICSTIENKGNDIKLNSFEENKHSEHTSCTFKRSNFTKTLRRKFPWQDYKQVGCNKKKDIKITSKLLNQCDDSQIFDQLKYIFQLESICNIDIPPTLRRFYNKLRIRKIKRHNLNGIFNLDNLENNICNNYQKYSCILDKFIHLTEHSINKSETTFHSRLIRSADHELFESPYTSRILHPFIYRSFECFPSWVKVLCEIQKSKNIHAVPVRSTIDFCYIRPYHIAGVNGLLQRMFWPGIDMSECLMYPDFSVVALYKKLIIGCAFLVPDVGYNEAYISFMAVRPGWNRVGIATFMLYHLTQTCMGKDITLHVSASNPAICLYQKFGFKIVEVVLDFYEKFIPSQSRQSRHAFFLRLKR